jgi:hypothetical protein
MAGLIKNDDVAPVSDGAGDITDSRDPFQGDSQRFTWAREVGVGQLQDEVIQALGPDVRVVAFLPYDAEGAQLPVDAQNPITLCVTPSSADLAAVRQVLAAHKPDPYYGMSDEAKVQAQVREKISAGQTLTPEEMTLALQMLVAS